jgi:integrase
MGPSWAKGRHVVDFQCLRHGFITYLVTANCPPKVAQTLARHSTIGLTMDRYTHLGIDDLVAGLKRLPTMAGGNGAGKV